MRLHVFTVAAIMAGGVACSPPQPKKSDRREASDRIIKPDENSAARKAGHAAYGIAQETKKLSKEAGHKLKEAGRDARQGWNDAERENRDKHR
jgi:hypothetical protein